MAQTDGVSIPSAFQRVQKCNMPQQAFHMAHGVPCPNTVQPQNVTLGRAKEFIATQFPSTSCRDITWFIHHFAHDKAIFTGNPAASRK